MLKLKTDGYFDCNKNKYVFASCDTCQALLNTWHDTHYVSLKFAKITPFSLAQDIIEIVLLELYSLPRRAGTSEWIFITTSVIALSQIH